MQPGCFQCFNSLCMGLKKSKPRRFEGYDGLTSDEVSKTFQTAVTEYNSIHGDSVTCIDKFAPGTCVTGSKDKSVVLFDWKQGIPLHRWTGHTRDVTKVKHLGSTIYSSSRDKTIKAWQAHKNDPLLTFEGHRLVVTAIDLNDEGTLLFSGSRDNCVRLWDTTRKTSVSETEVSRNLVSCAKWIPGTQTLVAQTGEDKMLRVWDTRNMQPAFTFPAQQYFQTYCDCSRDGQFILTCSNGFNGKGCEATLWDVRARGMICRYIGHYQTTSACIFLPHLEHVSSKDLIATASHDSTVKIWEREGRECVTTLDCSGAGPLMDLCAWDDGSICVSTTNMGVYQCMLDSCEGKPQLTKKCHF
ncbi:WD REPEATS REGION domain-containing protein [Desmophyllum pertusum]|uniref:WD REPEATS REGION domain-containing protein n=1 Tax=Desmophyllum pertusum TaxID=174260 RepID=A0A9X0CID6_9CNID|nr:WD REPEATS REGION domain-containing protein [Desmophyllum pertusum]